ncbi:MAG: hypothetical protein IJ357_07560 [Oscillospiraceae bacterium]|nr:hypothetical protein [Oscillospiraceae bacterium]
MFKRLGAAIRSFMSGRYGTDQLNFVLLFSSLGLSLINWILSAVFAESTAYYYVYLGLSLGLSLGVYGLLGFAIFRMFSRNIYRRQRENRRLLNFWTRLKDRKNRYFRCPNCKQTVRVPRHRGKINIRCPKCGEKFIRKT